jgi:putative acetyltransferase
LETLIRDETPDDHDAIREVNRLAFGQDDEGRLVDALRAGGHVRASLLAEVDGRVVGHILFSALPIATPLGTVEAMALAPMAVIPDLQRRGIGSALVREGLRTCAGRGQRVVVVLGHPAFYTRFGFTPELARRLKAPFSGPAFMALELIPGALEGIEGEVRYPAPFEDVSDETHP